MNPRCKFCGKEYNFPTCELEARMYLRPGSPPGEWGKETGANDFEKFETWSLRQFDKAVSEEKAPGELGLNMVLLGHKEGLTALVPLLAGTEQRKWDFIIKRLFPLSFSLTHARPGGYETERLQKWMDQNFSRLRWNDEKKAFILSAP